MPKPLGSQRGTQDAGVPDELRTAPQAPGASAGEVRRKYLVLCTGAASGSQSDAEGQSLHAPRGQQSARLLSSRCRAHKGRGDAIVCTS